MSTSPQRVRTSFEKVISCSDSRENDWNFSDSSFSSRPPTAEKRSLSWMFLSPFIWVCMAVVALSKNLWTVSPGPLGEVSQTVSSMDRLPWIREPPSADHGFDWDLLKGRWYFPIFIIVFLSEYYSPREKMSCNGKSGDQEMTMNHHECEDPVTGEVRRPFNKVACTEAQRQRGMRR